MKKPPPRTPSLKIRSRLIREDGSPGPITDWHLNHEPFSFEEQRDICLHAVNFFTPLSAASYKLKDNPQPYQPLTGLQFLEYLKMEYDAEIDTRMLAVHDLLLRMETAGLLVPTRTWQQPSFSHGLERAYTFKREFTKIQVEGYLWLGPVLGLPYIANSLAPAVVQLTGTTSKGDLSNGSGVLTLPNIIITCAHVIKDMVLDRSVWIGDKEYIIQDVKCHSSIDVGVIQLAEPAPVVGGLSWGHGNILEDIVMLGYPPTRMAQTVMTAQRGEITGYSEGTDKNQYMLFSSIARPGNSGGPLVSSRGQIVGIVTRSIHSPPASFEDRFMRVLEQFGSRLIQAEELIKQLKTEARVLDSDPMPFLPFFAAISSAQVRIAVTELIPEISLPFEDYD